MGRWRNVFYGSQNSKYLTRWHLTAAYKFHVFHRGDEDPDPHDHPWDYWTMPLVGYHEEYWVYDDEAGRMVARVRWVQAWRWHQRRAEHIHRVLDSRTTGRTTRPRRIFTLIRVGPVRRDWGFWVKDHTVFGGRRWVQWQEYLRLKGMAPAE